MQFISRMYKSSIRLFFLLLPSYLFAQYFGQNQLRHESFDFKLKQTEHFEVYYYSENERNLNNFLRDGETWYKLHKNVFGFDLPTRNAIILYDNQADFQSTTAIEGGIGVGTGGVTEGIRNRIVMPFFPLRSQTRHVLGHEMVHAFQYKTIFDQAQLSYRELANIPLWMTEGMAEYLSIGKIAPHTAMWMRDAVLHDDIPTLKEMGNYYKYFPYTYGHAFWAFIGSTYGDSVIVPLFVETAKKGLDGAIRSTFGFSSDMLSNVWKGALKKYYGKFLKESKEKMRGRVLIDSVNGGKINVSPAISPDGRKVVYFSTRDLLSLDLYVSDLDNLKKAKKLSSRIINSHIDEFNFIESVGTWSPDSEYFAFGAFSSGIQKLVVVDVETGKNIETFQIPGIKSFSNPVWSPDGENIVFSGFKNEQSDLYMYNMETDEATQLTDDTYSDYQPNFSPDGKKIIFSTDRQNFGLGNNKLAITFSLAILDLETKKITNLPVFERANNLDAHFSPDGKSIFFLSNRDGFRNIYRYNLTTQKIYQLTDFFTGVSGITEYSPAISLSNKGDLVYTYYGNKVYSIYQAVESDFLNKEVKPDDLDFSASVLPMGTVEGKDEINPKLHTFGESGTASNVLAVDKPYHPKFQLEYIGPAGSFGVGYSALTGVGLAGAVYASFGDILGQHKIGTVLSLQGEIYSAGLFASYTNKKTRWDKSVFAGHIPQQSYFSSSGFINDRVFNGFNTNYKTQVDQIWTFQEVVGGSWVYPFSRIYRGEFSLSLSYFSYLVQSFNYYYAVSGSQYYYVGFDKERRNLAEFEQEFSRRSSDIYTSLFNNFKSAFVTSSSAYFVGDNSVFGQTGPINGYRFRVGGEYNYGNINYAQLTADFRYYKRFKPITLAFRNMNFVRANLENTDKTYQPFYLGNPSFVRGYSNFFSQDYLQLTTSDNLVGTNMVLFNFELRLPFTGVEKFALVKSNYFRSDLSLFLDAGVTWLNNQKVSFSSFDFTQLNNRYPVVTTGISLRTIVLGQLVLELYYATILKDEVARAANSANSSGFHFGMNIAPGW